MIPSLLLISLLAQNGATKLEPDKDVEKSCGVLNDTWLSKEMNPLEETWNITFTNLSFSFFTHLHKQLCGYSFQIWNLLGYK